MRTEGNAKVLGPYANVARDAKFYCKTEVSEEYKLQKKPCDPSMWEAKAGAELV